MVAPRQKDCASPADVVDPLLWRDAQFMLGRHSGSDDRELCVWCGRQWPCAPRRLAERADLAARRPWREAWTARHDRNGMRALPECRNEGPGSRRYGLDAVNESPGTQPPRLDVPATAASMPETAGPACAAAPTGAPQPWADLRLPARSEWPARLRRPRRPRPGAPFPGGQGGGWRVTPVARHPGRR